MGTLQGRDLADVGLDRRPHVVAVRLQEEDLATVQAGKDQGLAAAGLWPSQGTILRPARGDMRRVIAPLSRRLILQSLTRQPESANLCHLI